MKLNYGFEIIDVNLGNFSRQAMAIITLTTDLGHKDFYIAAVKAKLIESISEANIIDVSHVIEPFDIIEGAFILGAVFEEFPPGTIHLVGVHTSIKSKRHLIVKKADHYFIGPDNGIFSLMFKGDYDELFEMIIEGDTDAMFSFPLKELYVKLAAFIATGGALDGICEKTTQMHELMAVNPIRRGNMIQGSVIHIDNYGNAIINVTLDLFTQVGNGFPFRIHYRRKEFIDYICTDYADVPEGEVLAIFGDAGYLQIAINKDKAADLLGLSKGTQIQIEFI